MSDSVFWDLWFPKAASTGLPFARGELAPTQALLVHAAPDLLTVEVRDPDGRRLASGKDLERTLQSPICLLRLDGEIVRREDLWPTDSEIGLPVLLPGGEVGILTAWWNADDRKEWRWSIELSNSVR
ncbi:MAG: hypothetical protein AB7P33_16940 [Dehalococcoidia bacterium]